MEVEVEGWTLFSDVVVSVSEEAWDGESWGEPPSAIPARLQWAATRSTCMSRTLSSCVVVSIFVPTSISLASSFPICTARSVSMFSRIAFRFRSVVFYVTLRDKKRRISVESIFQKKPTFLVGVFHAMRTSPTIYAAILWDCAFIKKFGS